MSRRPSAKNQSNRESLTVPQPIIPQHNGEWNPFAGHQHTFPQMGGPRSYPGLPPPLPTRDTFISDSSYSARRRPGYDIHVHPNETTTEFWAFPQPEVTSPDAFDTKFPSPEMNSYRSESSSQFTSERSSVSGDSFETTPTTYKGGDELSKQLSQTQAQNERIKEFQEGALPEEDEEWHRLCTPELRTSLPKAEVQRQSTIFEVVKSERDYVLDLQMIESIFIMPLLSSDPPIIAPTSTLEAFIKDVFSNVSEIEKIHQSMVASLFRRQRKEHPIITSIADILLDAALSFQEQYEVYIKHYPIAEGRHRRELKENPAYARFIERAAQDTRTRKRDLITLISRPVTRLPRLALMLEHIQKLTPAEHSDLDNLPITLGVLNQLLKSTQPGIVAAEGKVKLRNMIESLLFEKGEVVDLDPSNENRTLIYTGPLARQESKGWVDLEVALLDNYLLMGQRRDHNGISRFLVVSRPIPLEFLRLGSFKLPTETRKVTTPDGEPRSRISTFFTNKDSTPAYPFVVSHAALQGKRRYTLCANSDSVRRKWYDSLRDAIGLRDAQQQANRLFAVETLADNLFRSLTALVPLSSPLRKKSNYFTGKITCAARFALHGRNYIALGCSTGVFVGYASQPKSLRKALELPNAVALASLGAEQDGQLIVLQDGKLISFPLEALAKTATNDANQALPPLPVLAAKNVAIHEAGITMMVVGPLAERIVVCYAVKHFRHTTVHTLEYVLGQVTAPLSRTTSLNANPTTASSNQGNFRNYAPSFHVPKEASAIVLLPQAIAVPAGGSVVIVRPTLHENSADRRVITVPDFTSCNPAAATLKSRCQNSTTVGIIPSGDTESLLIYDAFGVWVSKYGYPTRGRQYVRWETHVVSYVSRSPYVLLISSEWIEIRHVPTGRLEQVVSGSDIRHIQIAEPNHGALLLAMKGELDDATGMSDKLVEVLETRPLLIGDETFRDPQWGEWDI
ncbi:hypothetical protein FRB95_011836 [Tulasnella sp. JGI-2019a]|nr:hypothetical protein FRB95_011836 [Tulasnella sp. JGI-2019a]